jgi:sugar/nucleoside kinase (ribokinase family)
VVGHTNVDRFLLARKLPEPDRTVPLQRQATHLGGTAGNIARAAAGLGLRVGLVSAVGDDFPSAFRQTLRAEGIDLRGLRRVPGVASSTCFIVEDGRGGQMTLIDQGVLSDEQRFEFPVAPVRRAAWAHLTTGPPDSLLALADGLQGGPRIAADPAQEIQYRWDRPRLIRLLERSELLFGNRAEIAKAADLLGYGSSSRLLERVPLVVTTLGPKGVMARTRAGSEKVPGRRPNRIRQVTGAGDAFRGGFYCGWIRGAPLRSCLKDGVVAASAWIEGGGSLGRQDRPAPLRDRR